MIYGQSEVFEVIYVENCPVYEAMKEIEAALLEIFGDEELVVKDIDTSDAHYHNDHSLITGSIEVILLRKEPITEFSLGEFE